jgi:hypothetical protein
MRSAPQYRSPPMKARPILVALLLAGALFAAGCGSSSSSSTTSSSASASSTGQSSSSTPSSQSVQIGFEGVPIEQGPELAPASTTGTQPVAGIQCGPTEQLAYHIHVHLAVFDNGTARALPGGIGISGSTVQQSPQGPVAVGGVCIYWLHTHAPDGIIHIESPTRRVYTLGNFFDEWHQPLSATQVGTVAGKITAYVNGKRWTASPRAIPLDPHAVIQLNVGSPPAPLQSVNWSQTQL